MQPEAAGAGAKQQIVDKIKQSTNILVAVSANPTVDSLAAAIGLTLMINKLDKHATAVFSGEIPPAMQFLEPNKTLENSVDGLRDFIISLDKEKADRLRYKVENDVVRIFITPYRTTISEKDLQFSQGDFNVELIIALGVEKRDDLDKAIIAHGRILHDATVVTVNANNQQSSLGAIDWREPNASSLCEMLISVAQAMQKPGLVDAQIATALLTGMVAATDRFSNPHTTPQVMTLAAQMMAAGANQQLVVNNIQPAIEAIAPAKPASAPAVGKDGEISINHPKEPKEIKLEKSEPKAVEDDIKKAEEELAKALPQISTAPVGEPNLDDLKEAIKEETAKQEKPKIDSPRKFIADEPGDEAAAGQEAALTSPESSWRERRLEPPTMGGSFTATSQQALEDAKIAEDEDRNKKILTHGDGLAAEESQPAPTPEAAAEETQFPNLPPLPPIDVTPPIIEPVAPSDTAAPEAPPQPEPVTTEIAPPSPSPATVDEARQEVDAVLAAQPFNPAGNPLIATGSQQFSEPMAPMQPVSPPPAASAEPKPALNPSAPPVIPPMPQLPVTDVAQGQMPPMPPTLPELPTQMPPPVPPSAFDTTPPPPPVSNDPAQYKIPGQ